MLDNFYFKYVEIENYDNIIAEIRQYILKEIEKISKPGFSLLDNNQDFIENCPLFHNWVVLQGLEISRVAVHILESNTIGYLHTDSFSNVSSLALNMDIQNCAGTQTKFYTVTVPGNQHTTLSGSLSYTVFDFNKTCTEVDCYDLKKPVLFNISKPHRVYNLKDTKRISLSVRFVLHPLHLL